jgi:hypothetical protein
MTYVALGTPRFRIEQTGEGESLVIPSHKNVLIILFLSVWLGGWTIGGIAAASELVTSFQPFLAFWLCGWAIGWLMATFILSWMLTGWQRLRFMGADLAIETSALWFTRRALYRGRDIRGLKAVAEGGHWQGRQFPPMPLLGRSRGAVRFNYGARTHTTGFGLDEPEANAIVDWLSKRLPEASK